MRRISAKVKIISIILLVVSIIAIITTYIVNDNIREFVDTKILKKEISDDSVKNIYTNSSVIKTMSLAKNVVTLSSGELKVYDFEGNAKNTIKMKIGNPIYDIEDRYLGIADKNVTKIYLIEDDKLLWEKTLDVTVEKIEVNRNGYMAVVTKDSVYKSVVLVYSNKGELLLKSYVSNGYVIDTEISPDNKYLVIGEVDYSKTYIESTVKVIDIKKAMKSEENSVVNTFVKDKLLINIKIKENLSIIAQYSDSVVNIGYNNNENKEIYKLSNVYIVDIENTRYSLVIKKEEQDDIIKLKNTYVCIIFNESGNEVAKYNIGDTTPKNVLAKLDSIAINLGTELVVINQNGWIKKKYNSTKEISRYDISSYIITIWYNDKIDIVGL